MRVFVYLNLMMESKCQSIPDLWSIHNIPLINQYVTQEQENCEWGRCLHEHVHGKNMGKEGSVILMGNVDRNVCKMESKRNIDH